MGIFNWLAEVFPEYWTSFLKGTGYTLVMALTGTLIGFAIGLLVAIVRTIPTPSKAGKARRGFKKAVDFLLTCYVEIIRGTPMLVQALIIHYGLFVYLEIPSLISAIIIISFNTGAYMAEIVRGGIISIDNGQFEGAQALGMTHWQTMTQVVLPQAIRNIMPSVSNEFVVNIKDSSVLSVISIVELMFVAKQAGGAYADYLPSYVICALIYLVLTFTTTRILRLVEKKLAGSSTYVICGSQSNPDAEIRVNKEA
ncbi:MAG: amino acid ABC transporter permease [Clostridia bacterium]|nr:amino acid ABC transporter permease [Clostridia bacterium]